MSTNGQLPKGWTFTPLGEAANNLDGKRVPLKAADREKRHGDYPYYGASGVIDQIDDYLFDGDFLLVAEDGANLLARSTPIAFLASGKFWVNNHAHVLACNGKASLRFLQRYLCSVDVKRFVTGSAQPKLNRKNLDRIEIPLPPLAEQKRIADILDKADAIRRKRQEAIASSEKMANSLFSEFTNKSKAAPKTVAELLDSDVLLVHKDGNYGGSYPRKHEFGSEGIPFLSAKHVAGDGTLLNTNVPRLNEEKARTLPFGWIVRGDVLLAHNATVGPVGLYRGEYEEALIGTSLTCYRPNPKCLMSEFLFAALRGSHFQRQLAKEMSQTTRNQVPITAQRKLSLHVPSLEHQEAFGRELSSIHELRVKYVKALAKSHSLFSSLVQRAFKGEL
jgi:type I restriction enzyme, S subunit